MNVNKTAEFVQSGFSMLRHSCLLHWTQWQFSSKMYSLREINIEQTRDRQLVQRENQVLLVFWVRSGEALNLSFFFFFLLSKLVWAFCLKIRPSNSFLIFQELGFLSKNGDGSTTRMSFHGFEWKSIIIE